MWWWLLQLEADRKAALHAQLEQECESLRQELNDSAAAEGRSAGVIQELHEQCQAHLGAECRSASVFAEMREQCQERLGAECRSTSEVGKSELRELQLMQLLAAQSEPGQLQLRTEEVATLRSELAQLMATESSCREAHEQREQELQSEVHRLRESLQQAHDEQQGNGQFRQEHEQNDERPVAVKEESQGIPEEIQKLRQQLESEQKNCAKWRKLVVEEQEYTSELQQQLSDAGKAKHDLARREAAIQRECERLQRQLSSTPRQPSERTTTPALSSNQSANKDLQTECDQLKEKLASVMQDKAMAQRESERLDRQLRGLKQHITSTPATAGTEVPPASDGSDIASLQQECEQLRSELADATQPKLQTIATGEAAEAKE